MSRILGDPARDLVILGEGNTSARADGNTFFVKASGKELGTADENSLGVRPLFQDKRFVLLA